MRPVMIIYMGINYIKINHHSQPNFFVVSI